MTNLLYMFNSDEKASIAIWMNEKLPERNYCIFTRDLCVNNIESNLFAFGFQSPVQVRVMRIAISFCLDATHGISARSGEVMYSLVTQHNVSGKGFPVAYMVTNNQTVRPISQWFMHLCERSYFHPLNITIDCSISEVNAITSAFPHVVIHYYEFHILCAWQTNLNNKLKTIYFDRARIRRLDRLMFILTNNVKYFYKQEVNRIHLNNGKMGPVENELARNEFAASKIEDDILPSMIISPLNVISTSMDDSDSKWQIKFFTNDTI
ncbi:hypothetical protein PHYBLDRAFT_64479 [Phycomyces blakesleeanus NRRL 1555(-)]|uniref:MULE transposase domain-containing protein n=1 Tax=Phycomyces blakesleeanus (strain ATCC 8743b / DSM 1359 / FGSC 10004 / NBRC 33097 / NRRL 1555) TaxID=763407 RepID=A0A162PSI0_PHYB8|nr:hypothetical protein PHYBLDRAFT_64479 [Phycomyces blakesleeanus NRRL 1555(-)]OAD75567.1 hypothetical protein PHYBLDRAFT_64479 [Phycomyces blakesleeanus NRRL 1555(-)]|eukprot:XP_018293607.1 hypothetical protein PHYBLDRAFT_64479 [Phycomyces blakesleeanus NRRL 1555(-)]